MDAWVWGVAALGLGGGVLLFRRWLQRRGDHLLDAMQASKYGFGGVAAPWDYDESLPPTMLGLVRLGPLFDELTPAQKQARLDREAARRLEALALNLNPPVLDMDEDPDVPEAPDLDMLVSIALKERGQHIAEVSEDLDRHARGAVLGEQVGLGVRVETVDVEDSTIVDRVEREGGASGAVQISLAWEDRNDLDLHVYAPSGERIYFNQRRSECGGELDVDMNARPTSVTPVENVVWKDNPPSGTYRVGVHFYRHHRRRGTKQRTTFTLRTAALGEVAEFTGTLQFGDGLLMVTSFTLP
ncbi:MAG TPA: hypothetical protein D7I09_08240 [Candidatus Poseidoniales archaeon]|nr:MAG TPA: hypothetical protein D7I09_08240 [Candidatus Poseidoniales archaeon]HII19297.1 YfaP family protein [Candidatus Poseidoniaceae archaeon]